jgi:beta-galactosidase
MTFTRRCIMCLALAAALVTTVATAAGPDTRSSRLVENFNHGWRFSLGCIEGASAIAFDDNSWRVLDVPHDWSIEGEFRKSNPATAGGGALPGGVGWYRKVFTLPASASGRLVSVEFDGVYCNSEVWINGHYLGKRPNGYISYRLDLTPWVTFGSKQNLIAVKVDNSAQPNSRWYSGSGIYRNVRLVVTDPIAVDHWGVSVTTTDVSSASARTNVRTALRNASSREAHITVTNRILDPTGREAGKAVSRIVLRGKTSDTLAQSIVVNEPLLWSIATPHLYRLETSIDRGGKRIDEVSTPFGIRFFRFDAEKGFLLNGERVKINGVCNHHDLGCLGSAVNRRALERQLEILRGMGVNGIRTSHNPPAPELLDLCDRMGFVVMDEAFDMWKKEKNPFDYSRDWDAWHKRDLTDQILRDRNHPSVVLWSIGNEVNEQWDRNDTSGADIARELCGIIRALDDRPITSNCNNTVAWNPLLKPGILDVVGYSYGQGAYATVRTDYPGRPFIASESVSSLATRGHYDMPADSIRRWPSRWDIPFTENYPENTCSAYDNVSAPWGNTQEEGWKKIKSLDWVSGQFIWTGFDYLGEPTPYDWPSRSSYFGIVDLAGFPKDTYYMYQSEWTATPVLHLLPHWNWKPGDTVDVWAYSSCPDVELFLNGKSLGAKTKKGDDLHLAWRVPYAPGTLHAVGRAGGKVLLTSDVTTAGAPSAITLKADRSEISADGDDLSFVTVTVLDSAGTIVPNADNLIEFTLSGPGRLAGVDNGLQTSHESFTGSSRKAFNGLCLAVIRSTVEKGTIALTARSKGLREAVISITVR